MSFPEPLELNDAQNIEQYIQLVLGKKPEGSEIKGTFPAATFYTVRSCGELTQSAGMPAYGEQVWISAVLLRKCGRIVNNDGCTFACVSTLHR